MQYIIGAGLVIWWMRAHKAKQTDNQHMDTIASQQGSDWIGTAWDRLSGADLIAKGYPNLSNGPTADPGKVGALNAGIMLGWDGTL